MVTQLVKRWVKGDDDDDEGENSWIVYVGTALLMLMCISLFKSCEELRFSFKGRLIQTTVDAIEEVEDKYGNVVGYKLLCTINDRETNTNMTAHVWVAEKDLDNYPPGQTIELQYIGTGPGDFQARLRGTHDYFWVVVFFSFLAILIGGFVWGCIHWSRVDAADKRGRKR